MIPARILIADDDPDIRELLQVYLHFESYEVIAACDGQQALQHFITYHPDLVILDVMMPGMDGMEVCRRIRANSHVPVVFLTGRDDEVDQLLGFGFGADDYIVKPFSPRTLVARVKALLRRTSAATTAAATGDISPEHAGHTMVSHAILSFAGLQIDTEAYQVTRFGKAIDLTAKEFQLLKYFAERPGKVLTKRQLVTGAWGEEYFGDDATLMVHLSHLRQKLGDSSEGLSLIVTIRGIGYKFIPQPEEVPDRCSVTPPNQPKQ
ncbi:MAG TPA: DNA-binding response regulator [Firmicutes bacterium]|mgnify:FL=1|jgi:DNA-binding response OmpR family regulator|nr:DNA-binding response regulator [Bacillota bacterium]